MMEWIAYPVLGALIGAIFSLFSRTVAIPFWTNVIMGAVGAVLGAAVDDIAGSEAAFGTVTDLIVVSAVSLVCLAGMTLAFVLTRSDRKQRTG